jgi:predicted aconitase
MPSSVSLDPSDLVVDILASRFLDLVAVLSRKDKKLALETLAECAHANAEELRNFSTVLEGQGTAADVQHVITAASAALQKVIVDARVLANKHSG